MTTPLRVLVTGATGQLGAELQWRAPASVAVEALDRKALDVTDADAVDAIVARARPAWIINAAAYTAVDRAESELERALRVNRDGARHVAAAASRVGARVLQVSTDFVFDGTQATPYLPDHPPHPLGAYGASKLAGEAAVAEASRDAVIVRTAWLYAAHGNNFVRTILRKLQEGAALRVVADQVGTPTSAASLATALWRLLPVAPTGGATLHFTDAGVASWYDFAVAVRELASARLKRDLPTITPIRTADYPTPARRPAYSVLDKTAMWALTGTGEHWRPPLQRVMHELLP